MGLVSHFGGRMSHFRSYFPGASVNERKRLGSPGRYAMLHPEALRYLRASATFAWWARSGSKGHLASWIERLGTILRV
jgi:hypothetical protein